MPTLYVDNVPGDLYEALRSRAKRKRTSISAEVLAILSESVPTSSEIMRRKALVEQARRMRSRRPAKSGPFPSAEEMLREDRAR